MNERFRAPGPRFYDIQQGVCVTGPVAENEELVLQAAFTGWRRQVSHRKRGLRYGPLMVII